MNEQGSLMKAYVVGFVLSLILTFAAYYLVTVQLLSGNTLLVSILVLAFVQLFVQLWFFLHLGREQKPRWNLIFFLSTAGIIFIVVAGSIWIMSHLNYNMMPHEVEEYVMEEELIYKDASTRTEH